MTRPTPQRSHGEERKKRAAARAERARAAEAAAEAGAAAAAQAVPGDVFPVATGPTHEMGMTQAVPESSPAVAASPADVATATGIEPPPTSAMAPPRDAGLTLGSRASRRHGPDPWLWPMVGIIVVVLGAGVAITALTKRATPRAEVAQPVTVASALPTTAVTNFKRATPIFAHYKDIQVHLPVAPENVTTLAYHQASYSDVLHMTSLIKEETFGQAIKASQVRKATKRAAQARSKARSASTTASGAATATVSVGSSDAPVETDNGVWTGRAIRLWRTGRRGKPDSAADVGANPGRTVLSPVSGIVLMVERYKLYNKYDDYKIHIRPAGHSNIDVIVMHITNPAVAAGETVAGGITPIAKVRFLSKLAPLQLGEYSGDKGDHVHVQLNLITKRLGLKPLLGQSEPPDQATTPAKSE